ncbi:MAG: serine/threonine protein kinase [Gemmatimonadota bacterium]|nr:serine/threonine protein kinase [Gemmatimonadota bacterium]
MISNLADAQPDPAVTQLRAVLGARYRVMHLVGDGGMANVYYAVQSSIDSPVVIKVLHSHLAHDAEMRERFRREAESAAKLFHPHICPILDFGMVDDTIYIVMPFLARGTLNDRIGGHRSLPPEATAAITAQVATGLDYAHRRGLVHRDIKPDNILFDEDDNAIITDFGIATAHFRSRVTGSGNVMGTPHYMSPEQARGKLLDGRSDLYALGVVMYETLLGFPPFDGADIYSISYKHVTEMAVSPEVVDSRIPAALSAIVMKCLEKKAPARYQRGNELADALIAFLASSASAADLRRAKTARAAPAPAGV